MKATIQDDGPCRKMLQIAAAADEVEPTFEEVTGVFTRIARVRGFRPGKAPRSMVERQYAKEIRDEVEGVLLPRLYRQAVQEHKLETVAIVNMSDVSLSRQEGISFQVTVDVPPDFALPEYERFKVDARPIEVSDAQVDDAVGGLQDRLARYEDVEGKAVARESLVQVDYTGRCGAEAVSSLAPKQPALGGGKDFWMLVGEQEFLPGVSEGLIGMKSGETREIRIVFPADYRFKEVAGCDALYTVSVKRIRERRKPALDAEFFKHCGVESEQVLRERLKQDLLEKAARDERSRRVAEVERFLLTATVFDVPQSVMAEETNLTLRNMVRSIIMEGGSRELVEQNREQIAGEAERLSLDRVRLTYVLSRIAARENIEVDDAEVDARISKMATSYNMQPAQLRAELAKRGGEERVRSDVRAEKTLNLLVDRATGTKEA
jgi:trigger factor